MAMLRCALLLALTPLGLTRPATPAADFTTWWNIPIFKCRNRHKLPIDLDQFDIVNNPKNSFYGEKVTIFYEPGKFPYYDKKGDPHNGGIPMLGDIEGHRSLFTEQMQKRLVNADYSGISVLDFEKYTPAFDGYLPKVMKRASEKWVEENMGIKQGTKENRNAAILAFNNTIEPFFKDLLLLNRELYPNALVGYYKFPRCNNWHYPYNECKANIMELSDKIHDMIYDHSTALFPRVYAYEDREELYLDYLTAVLDETNRVNRNRLPAYPYYWYKYHHGHKGKYMSYIEDEQALVMMWAQRVYGMDGVVLWGDVTDLDTYTECKEFRDYVNGFLGPLLQCLKNMDSETIIAKNDEYPLFDGQGATEANLNNRRLVAEWLKRECNLTYAWEDEQIAG